MANVFNNYLKINLNSTDTTQSFRDVRNIETTKKVALYSNLICLFFASIYWYMELPKMAIYCAISSLFYLLIFVKRLRSITYTSPKLFYLYYAISTLVFSVLGGKEAHFQVFFFILPVSAIRFASFNKHTFISKIEMFPVVVNLSGLVMSEVLLSLNVFEPEIPQTALKYIVPLAYTCFAFYFIYFIKTINSSLKFDSGNVHTIVKSYERAIHDLDGLKNSELKRTSMNIIKSFSSGIVHEINNPIAILKGATYQLKNREMSKDQSNKLIDMIERTSDRIAIIVRMLSDLTIKEKSLSETPVTLAHAIEYLKADKSNGILSEHDYLDFKVNDKDISTPVDLSLFLEVLTPIIKNALEAKENNSPAHINVEISSHINSNILCIEISDQGSGVKKPEELFLPFTTTKSPETNRGLGLTIVKNYLDRIGGNIALTNKKNPTVFRILFPTNPKD